MDLRFVFLIQKNAKRKSIFMCLCPHKTPTNFLTPSIRGMETT